MILVITLRRDVVDLAQAQQLTTIVKNLLVDHPDVQIQAQISDSVPLEAPG